MDEELLFEITDETLIPEGLSQYYTEQDGVWRLNVKGAKTSEDVSRVQGSLTRVRNELKETKGKLAAYAELGDFDDLTSRLDRIPELEAAAEGKLDESGIEAIVKKRLDAAVNSATAPLNRKLTKLEALNQELTTTNSDLLSRDTRRTITDNVQSALREMKALPEAYDDALLLANQEFEVDDEGKTVTREGSLFGAGLDPKNWLTDLMPKRPHWFPGSVGGGARDSRGGGGLSGPNPWGPRPAWNATEQSRIVREKGVEYAKRMARAAGAEFGNPTPPKPRRSSSGS